MGNAQAIHELHLADDLNLTWGSHDRDPSGSTEGSRGHPSSNLTLRGAVGREGARPSPTEERGMAKPQSSHTAGGGMV